MATKIDLTGQRFGKLTAIREVGPGKFGTLWEFRCDCGTTVIKTGYVVKRYAKAGHEPNCGADGCNNRLPPPRLHPPVPIDIAGQKFGKLTALKWTGRRNKRRYYIWRFRCDCGRIVERTSSDIVSRVRRGKIPSCGSQECNNHHKLKKGRSSRNQLLGTYKRNAKKRGIYFSLTDEEVDALFAGNCHYCGAPPSMVWDKDDLYGKFVYNGIDRIDNSKGYVPGNVVSCCKTCNHAKVDMSYEDFLAWIEKLIEHHG